MKNFPKRKLSDRIIKFDRNKLFKGHCGELYSYGNKEIILSNNYYSGNVTNKYTVEKGVTESRAYISHNNPKWLCDKLKSLQIALYNGITYDSGYYLIHISLDYIELQTRYVDEGISFSNHYDNIRELKKCKKDLSLFIKTLKNTTINDIKNNITLKHKVNPLNFETYEINNDFMVKYSGIS